MAYAPVFQSPCDSSADFGATTVATTETIGIVTTSGLPGGSIRATLATTNNATYFLKDFGSGSTVRYLQCDFRVATMTTWSLSEDLPMLHFCSGIALTTALLDVRIVPTAANATTYNIRLVDPVNAYVTTTGATTLTVGRYYTLQLRLTNSTYYLYLDRQQTAEVTQTGKTSSGLYIKSMAIGRWYPSTTGPLTGTLDYDNVIADNDMGTAPSSTVTKITDVYNGLVQRLIKYKSTNEAWVIRPFAEGNGDSTNSYASAFDEVDEGDAYMMNLALQNNDQTLFDKLEYHCYNFLERRNISSTGQISNGGAVPTTALHLMAFHINPLSSTAPYFDPNFAHDADLDRAEALFMADSKVKNGSWTNTIAYRTRALAIVADLKSYGFNSYKGLQYMGTGAQDKGTSPFEQNVSYFDIIALKRFRQETSDQFWDQAILGCYDTLSKVTVNSGALATIKGLYPDWNKIDNLGVVSVDGNGGRDSNLGFDATRTFMRLYRAYIGIDDVKAKTYLTGNIYTFLSGAWNSGAGSIKAVYGHDGTVVGNYEQTLFYAMDMFSFYANGDTTQGDNIYNNRVLNTYVQHIGGSFYSDNPTTPSSGNASYYGGCLTTLCIMLKEKLINNTGVWKDVSSQGFF